MRDTIKKLPRHLTGQFMFLRALNQPTWKESADTFAMDTFMLAGSLALMTLNPLNKNMMKDDEFTSLWKSAVTMVLGMGAGMLSYHLLKAPVDYCCGSKNSLQTNGSTSSPLLTVRVVQP